MTVAVVQAAFLHRRDHTLVIEEAVRGGITGKEGTRAAAVVVIILRHLPIKMMYHLVVEVNIGGEHTGRNGNDPLVDLGIDEIDTSTHLILPRLQEIV
jgi:hypothetical protein